MTITLYQAGDKSKADVCDAARRILSYCRWPSIEVLDRLERAIHTAPADQAGRKSA